MIYTSYFARLKQLVDIIPVSICGKAPIWYKGFQYKKLAPKYDSFMEWKKNHNNDLYIEHFKNEVLNNLNPHEIVEELQQYGENIALICYEKPSDFCHRHLVASWLNQNGHPVTELVF